jgi:hypothetical protein
MGHQLIFKKFDLAQLADGYCFFACGRQAGIQPPSPHIRRLERSISPRPPYAGRLDDGVSRFAVFELELVRIQKLRTLL